MNKYFASLILSIITFATFAQEKAPTFEKHMLIHVYKGCPQNSSCTKAMGELYSKWEATVSSKKLGPIKKFIKEHGAPLSLWTKDKQRVDTITFDSRCWSHRQKENYIFEAIRFTKSPKSYMTNENDMAAIAIREKTGKIYIVPRKSLPHAIGNTGLHYLEDSLGTYYNLVISLDSIKVNFDKTNTYEVLSATCKEKTIEAFKVAQKGSSLYRGVYCKKIWNLETKSYETMAFGWSCL